MCRARCGSRSTNRTEMSYASEHAYYWTATLATHETSHYHPEARAMPAEPQIATDYQVIFPSE